MGFFLLLLSCTGEVEVPSDPVCNGHAELCARPLDQVVFPATHNSMSSAADDWQLPNQPDGIRAQLDAGIRGMLLDTYLWKGEYYFCHAYCELGATPMSEGLGDIRDFLAENPEEVIVIIFQDDISGEQTQEAFEEAGLDSEVYTWTLGAWPTLGELVANKQRLLVTAEFGGPPPAWYQPAWELFSDTPYSFSSTEEFSCELNRGALENPLFLLNHWVEDPFPSEELSAQANAYDMLMSRAEDCRVQRQLPNLVAVDMYRTGDLFAVVEALNGF